MAASEPFQSTAGPGSRPPPKTMESVKDTIESIVVAFILAFVFRAFIIEAFVIPTGSMASTLYGEHGRMTCADCGWEFAYGLGTPQPLHAARDSVVCPNCNRANRPLMTADDLRNTENGDRILVFKWPLDIGGEKLGPHRWDVTVFKDPSDGRTNFIKRLIGMPNEVLEIIDGDIYTAPVDQLSPECMAGLRLLRDFKYQQRAMGPNGPLTPSDASTARQKVLKELTDKLRIQRKDDLAQQALWFIVYDNDFPPKRPIDRERPAWAPLPDSRRGVWETSGRTLAYRPADDSPQGIQLTGKDIVDFYAYNAFPEISRRQERREYPVSDVRLRLVLSPHEGNGSLMMRLAKRQNFFWCKISAGGQVQLFKNQGELPNASQELRSQQTRSFAPGDAVEVSFEIVDFRVSVYMDDQLVLRTDDDQFKPDIAELRRTIDHAPITEPPRIYAEAWNLDLCHVVVERDVYYRGEETIRENAQGGAVVPAAWVRNPAWGGTGNPIWLNSTEHFMCGDNSPQSHDSRLWAVIGPHLQARGGEYQAGTVPKDQLIGKAFFVYWPSGFRLPWLSDLLRFRIVPNVGEMRWIR